MPHKSASAEQSPSPCSPEHRAVASRRRSYHDVLCGSAYDPSRSPHSASGAANAAGPRLSACTSARFDTSITDRPLRVEPIKAPTNQALFSLWHTFHPLYCTWRPARRCGEITMRKRRFSRSWAISTRPGSGLRLRSCWGDTDAYKESVRRTKRHTRKGWDVRMLGATSSPSDLRSRVETIGFERAREGVEGLAAIECSPERVQLGERGQLRRRRPARVAAAATVYSDRLPC